MEGSAIEPMTRLRALNLIGGQWQAAGAAREGDSINPATGIEIGGFAASTRADAQQAIGAARGAFDRGSWSHNPVLRQALLLKWADRLAARPGLAQLLTLENGKVLEQSRHEIDGAIAMLRQYARLLDALPAGDAHAARPGLLRDPAGVVGVIVPWYAPVALLIGSLAPALAAGCTAVIKPAPQSAQVINAVLAELAALDGLPAGVVNLVSESGHEVASELVASPALDVIRFTGPFETGRKIAIAAAPTMKKLLLDLSGKSCSLVFSDVDVEQVARRLAAAATIGAGQHCSAARRILVHASRFDEAKAAMKRALKQIVVDAGEADGCGMGPLIDAAALVKVGVRTEQALGRCDEVVLRGRRLGGKLGSGYFLSPTLLAQRDCAEQQGQEEIFGPFVTLGQFEDDADAVVRANRMSHAQATSVWSADPERAMRVAGALRSGTVWLNHHGSLPVGGGEHGRLGHRQGGAWASMLDYLSARQICAEASLG